MRFGSRSTRLGWLSTFAAILAVVAQIAVAVAPLAEGREGPNAPSHVDPSGTAVHWVHNEASCASCQARSLHGTVARTASADLLVVLTPLVVAPAGTRVATLEPFHVNLSRAPPRVI